MMRKIFIMLMGFLWFCGDVQANVSSAPSSSPQSKPTKTSAVHPVKKLGSKTFNFDFQAIEVRSLLALIAKTANKNFVISDTVKGKMTLHLSRVTWYQALNIILKANGLGLRRFENVWLIAPISELANNEIMALQAKQRVALLAPLKSTVIRLNYANAKDIAKLLRGQQTSLLSDRGQVGVEPRTNSIWLRDVSKNINELRYFIKLLDVPARQVLIEARIVSMDKLDASDIGARFGVTHGSHLSGSFASANSLAGGTSAASVSPSTGRFNFNLPAIPAGSPAGSIALALARIGARTFLDLELSALERERRAKTISSPRVITSNQQPAFIEQGEEIPYLSASSSGATTVEFKKAVLSLKITPQITPDNNIILKLKVTQNTRGEQIRISTADLSPVLPPAINTKEVDSQVFLRNGETIVLGGIYERTKSNEIKRVPFFSSIPVLGHLFKNKALNNEREELMIFITPKIVDQSAYRGHHASHSRVASKRSRVASKRRPKSHPRRLPTHYK